MPLRSPLHQANKIAFRSQDRCGPIRAQKPPLPTTNGGPAARNPAAVTIPGADDIEGPAESAAQQEENAPFQGPFEP